MTAKILWEIGSTISFIIGIMHLRGTLFTTLLHPTNKKLIEVMKDSPMEVDPTSLTWNGWIGFNAAFSVCLIFMGFVNFYLAYMHFEIVKGLSVIFVASIVSVGLLIWIAHKYLIKKVERVFMIILIFYCISAALSF